MQGVLMGVAGSEFPKIERFSVEPCVLRVLRNRAEEPRLSGAGSWATIARSGAAASAERQ